MPQPIAEFLNWNPASQRMGLVIIREQISGPGHIFFPGRRAQSGPVQLRRLLIQEDEGLRALKPQHFVGGR